MTAEAHSGDLRNSQLFLDDRLARSHCTNIVTTQREENR